MPFTLSLSLNPLVNRFAEPEDLIETVAHKIGIRDVHLIRALTRRMQTALKRFGVRVTSGMTGPYGRLNNFGHPERDVRRYYLDWFKSFADIIADLGGASIGTQFAIMTHRDYDDPARRASMISAAMDCWAELAEHGQRAGLKFLFWEPMSVGREFGETIEASMAVQKQLSAAGFAIPVWMMADIDHGDLTSANPCDYDPYAWARAVPRVSPIIHIKQSLMDKGGHRPFTAENNAKGNIQPEKLIAAFREGGGENNEICMELSFRERDPVDRRVVADLAESVAYWAPHIDSGAADLRKS
jgi:sugar phosphate isomerase/epimerase